MSRRLNRSMNDNKRWDDVDDRLHDVFRKDEPDFQLPTWRSLRKGRTLSVLGLVVLLYLAWINWPKRSITSSNWSRNAYVTYAVDEHNLCNAVMVMESLHRHGSKAKRVILHNPEWVPQSQGGKDKKAELLTIAKNKYKVQLKPVKLLDSRGEVYHSHPEDDNQPSTWDTSVTKLRAFELTDFDRLIALDSDITLLNHVDELFHLPQTPIAMPRAYWSDANPHGAKPLTSLLMVIQPHPPELRRFLETLHAWHMNPSLNITASYDMDLLNQRFGNSALVLPQRPYALLTAEFRKHDHIAYLGVPRGDERKEWNADKIVKEAKVVHFTDWPLPKPWMMWPDEALAEIQPDCSGLDDCRERAVWKGLYEDFRKRRREVCKILPVNAPNWTEWKHAVKYGREDEGGDLGSVVG